ncbi:MAG: class I SAM-dependent methyltransferase [Candidatus Omnitrophica bacterium]|nr:class I SAM-dependent methyltransferase [Candidatus Omnitrophota bacterium]
MDKTGKTKKSYGFLWTREVALRPAERWHFNNMQEAIGEPIVRGDIGIDVGSGCGFDSYIMAKNNPSVRIVSIDISDGVYTAKKLSSGLNNMSIIKTSILDIPIKDNIFDFAYSFGVLHHTADPRRSLGEIARILKKDSPVFLYLYEAHSDNIIKYIGIKIVSLMRLVTVRLSPRALYRLCWFFSPFVYTMFSLPAKVLKRFKFTQNFAGTIPFNFGKGIFSLRGDLYDRFSAPIEYRFTKESVIDFLREGGFSKIKITRLKDTAGWVAWGYKV